MTMRRLFALTACAALLAGCSEEYVSDDALHTTDNITTVRLRIAAGEETRAQLDGRTVRWQEGDRFRVNGIEYTLEGSESDGWWLDVAEADSYEAFYPADLVRDGRVTLPATQHYTAASFDPAAHPMYAENGRTDGELRFRNLCGLVGLQLTGDGERILRIALRGNDGELLAGSAASADPTEGLVIAAGDDASTEVTLLFDDETRLSSEPLECFLTLPPTGFAEGFTLTVTTDAGTMTRSASGQQVVRSGLLAMPPLVFEADRTEAPDYSDPLGVFVLNEGNMTTESGSLIWISPEGEVYDDIYRKANGTTLGNSTQDLCIADGRIYVISQSGGGDGMLVSADLKTMQRQKAWSAEELSALSRPTHLAVLDEQAVFIRDGKGIYRFDGSGLTFVEGSERAKKLPMAIVGGRIFAAGGPGVIVLERGSDAVVREITLEGTVTGVVRSADGNLWVSTTSPARILKLDAESLGTVAAHEIATGSLSAGFGATSGITAAGDILYYCGATTTVYRHDFATDQTAETVDVSELVENASIVYNNIAAHPLTGRVYMTTIKGYGTSYLTNNITVLAPEGDMLTLEANYTDHTRFPAGIFFTAAFE